MSAALAEPTLTTVERVKLQLMDGIDAAIRGGGHRNYRQAAIFLHIDPEHMYRLRSRDPSLFSVVWLINTADRLGALVSVNVVPPTGTVSQPSQASPSTPLPKSVGVNQS